jgi:copper chaperone CopZ
MRCVLVLALFAFPALGEFLEVRVGFEDGGCVPCVESLRGRLERVRGMQSVEISLEKGEIRMTLERGNRVRMGPLQSRIRQGGTKLTSFWVRALGTIVEEESGLTFLPEGLARNYRLEAPEDAFAGPAELAGELVEGESGEPATIRVGTLAAR